MIEVGAGTLSTFYVTGLLMINLCSEYGRRNVGLWYAGYTSSAPPESVWPTVREALVDSQGCFDVPRNPQ